MNYIKISTLKRITQLPKELLNIVCSYMPRGGVFKIGDAFAIVNNEEKIKITGGRFNCYETLPNDVINIQTTNYALLILSNAGMMLTGNPLYGAYHDKATLAKLVINPFDYTTASATESSYVIKTTLGQLYSLLPGKSDPLLDGKLVTLLASNATSYTALTTEGEYWMWGGINQPKKVFHCTDTTNSKIYNTSNSFLVLTEDKNIKTWGSTSVNVEKFEDIIKISGGVQVVYSTDHSFILLLENKTAISLGVKFVEVDVKKVLTSTSLIMLVYTNNSTKFYDKHGFVDIIVDSKIDVVRITTSENTHALLLADNSILMFYEDNIYTPRVLNGPFVDITAGKNSFMLTYEDYTTAIMSSRPNQWFNN